MKRLYGILSNKDLGDVYTLIENPETKKDFRLFVIFMILVFISTIIPFIFSSIAVLIEFFKIFSENESNLDPTINTILVIMTISRWVLAISFNGELSISSFLTIVCLILELIMAKSMGLLVSFIYTLVILAWGYYFKLF